MLFLFDLNINKLQFYEIIGRLQNWWSKVKAYQSIFTCAD